jgi:RNA-directed DNA polymerase
LRGGVDLVVSENLLGKSLLDIRYDDIISVQNLLAAWREFRRGKSKRKDVQEFEMQLMDNIFSLHDDLRALSYVHGPYEAFNISDPKPRNIHKATVRDRLLHHAIYRVLYPAFDKTFICHSYSCRMGKGTHRAMAAFQTMARQVSNNHTRTVWVLKCDVRKFFASIDHEILKEVLRRELKDADVLWLLGQVIDSFETVSGKGLPLGNLTSQLLVNVYMNEFDQFVKHTLKLPYYIRYADDFVILDQDRCRLGEIVRLTVLFLRAALQLELHPHKAFIATVASGVDFLGYVYFTDHHVLRTVTKRRMLKRVQGLPIGSATAQSYLGLMLHGNTYGLQARLKESLECL